MGDRGILRAFHLCARVFEILVQTLIFKNCLNGGHCHNWRHVPLSMRFLAVYCFLSKVEGMDDWGIMRTSQLCSRVFEILSAHTFSKIAHPAQVFFCGKLVINQV